MWTNSTLPDCKISGAIVSCRVDEVKGGGGGSFEAGESRMDRRRAGNDQNSIDCRLR